MHAAPEPQLRYHTQLSKPFCVVCGTTLHYFCGREHKQTPQRDCVLFLSKQTYKTQKQRQIQKSREAYTLFDYGNASVTTRAPSKHNACTHHRRGQVQTTAHVKCTHEKTKTHNKMSMHLSKTNAKKLQQNVQRRLGN